MQSIVRVSLLMGLAAILLGVTGCRSTYYSIWETFGKHKRDLLRDQVEEAKEDQEKASEQFKDALTRLKEFYGISGGNLEAAYRKLDADYQACNERATQVKDRIEKMETIAEDLFTEWEAELEYYNNARLKANSQEQLRQTRARYQSLRTAMQTASRGMDPVLVQFRDHVLYLKHNLNAQAIGALKGEVVDIEKEIGNLIQDMNKSIAEADEFIKTL